MNKYVIKESELRSIIEMAVANELINEGLGHALLKTAGYAALGALAPGVLANKGIMKANDILGGNSTIGGTLNDFFGGNANGYRKGSSDWSRSKKNTARYVKREYGEPATEAGLRKHLEGKTRIVEEDFLGSGEEADFGRHYREVNQDADNSMWRRKLKRAEEAINNVQNQNKVDKYRRQYYKLLKEWLDERDKAYEAYIKSIR